MQGRFHLYEGYAPHEVTFPIRVLRHMDVRTLLLTNAAGGMNPAFRRGDLMLVTDHINLQGVNPLTGPNFDDWGPRFPDMSAPYDPGLRERAKSLAEQEGVPLKEGVYAAVVGPHLETRAEYRFLHGIGADADELVTHIGRGNRLHRRIVQFHDDVARGFRRQQQRVIVADLDAGIA